MDTVLPALYRLVTRALAGNRRSVFQAFWTGGSAILGHNHLAEGVPGAFTATPDGPRIDPTGDGLVYCTQGWHVVSLALFDDPTFYGGNNQLFAFLSSLGMQFVLDGVPLTVQRTAIKRVADNPPDIGGVAYGIGFGAFLPPGALSPGTHQLQTFIHDPVNGDFNFQIGCTGVSC
jgi:hypothetical protein